MKKSFVTLAALVSAATGFSAVEMPANYTHLGWIESDKSAKQWINTEYVPKVSTVITGRFQLKDRSESWASMLGAFNVNDNSQNGVLLRFNNNTYNIEGIFCNDHSKGYVTCSSGADYDFLLKRRYFKIGDKDFTYADGNCYEETKMPGFSTPIYVFAECNNNGGFKVRRQQPTRFYWLTFADEDGTQRDFRPCMKADGKLGFWDRVEGKFYGNEETGNDFAYGGIVFTKDPESGAMAVTAGGALSAEDVEGVTTLAVNLTSATDVLEAGVVTSLDALAVNAGAFSLQDDKDATCEVSGAVTLAGGAELKLDVTEDGVDAISAGSVVITGEGTVKISVRGVGTTSLAADQAILSGGNLTDADLAKFTLAASVPCELKVKDGDLVLAVKAADAVTWTGTSGNWSAAENWADGKKPGAGALVTIDQTAGGTANQDISDLSIGSLAYAADAGSFTLTGGGLGVSTKIDDKSAAAQTVNLPLTLGMAGKTAEIAAAGDLAINGDLTLAGTRTEIAVAEDKTVDLGVVSGVNTLAVKGPGTVRLTKDSPAFSGNIEVTGGTLQNMREVPFADAGEGDEIRVSNGGTLVIGPDNAGAERVNYKNRKLVLSGAGVNGQGAATYNGENRQYYAFREAELAGDATIGSTKGRWDVRSQSNVGTFNFNGHTLTKVGAGQFTLSDAKVTNGDTPAGLDINEGTVLIERSSALVGAENTLNVGAAGRLQIYQLVTPLSWTMNFAGGAQFDSQDGGLTVNQLTGPMTLGEGTVTFTTLKNNTATITSPVTGAGKLKKAGEGSLYLSGGAKTFTGGVEIDKGRLYVASKDQLPDYAEDGKVKVTGDNAGVILQSHGWTVDDFSKLLGGFETTTSLGFVGYAAEDETTISGDLAHANASVWLHGADAPLTVTGDLSFPAGKLTAEGDVTLSGAKTGDFKTAYVFGDNSVLTVKDGYTLLADAGQELRVSDQANMRADMVVSNATVHVDPLPGNGVTSGALILSYYFNAGSVLEVQDGGLVQHKILGGRYASSHSSILIRKGGRIDNLCGSGNDGYIAYDGYGFMENAGTYTMSGYSEVQGANTAQYRNAVGLLYNTGDIKLTANTFDLQRGGTGVVYQTSGTIDIGGDGIQITSQHSGEAGAGIYTIDGPDALTKVTKTLYGANKTLTEGILNLVNGGTLDYGTITARENSYDANKRQTFYVNFGGGFLKPRNGGNLFKDGERYAPTRVTAFAGGMGVEVGEGLSVTLNVPVRAPEGRGVKSVTPGADALAKEYLGAPFVAINGDGYGATAVALYDSVAKRITGIKVTSPGCNYTWATASLAYAKKNENDKTDCLAAAVTLTDGTQACGGLVKKGAGTLKVAKDMLAEKMPITLKEGVLDLGGQTVAASVLTLAGGTYCNGTIVADKVVGAANAFLPAGMLVGGGELEVETGALSVDTRAAGLLMTLIQCADADGVRALMKDDAVLDWSAAVPVFDFNRANSQQGWGYYQILAYKGYIWNRGTSDVTWTFGELFDDGTKVIIDGKTVLDYDESWNQVKLGTATLTSGAHTFEVRFGQIEGGAGPANQTNHSEWPASTLAFGIDYSGSDSYDINLYDRLTDISSGDVFTMSAEDVPFAPGSLTVEPGAAIDFNGDQQNLTYDQPISISAADLAAGRRLTFGNASITFAPGTTVTVTDIDQLDLEAQNRYVIAEAPGGLAGFENLVFATPAPKGWAYELRKNALVLSKKNGFMILVY